MATRGRPREVDDELAARLLRAGVKAGVLAAALGVHPKTVERARRRYVEVTLPTIERLRTALRKIAGLTCYCECAGDDDCAPCYAKAVITAEGGGS